MNGTRLDLGRNQPFKGVLTANTPGFKHVTICNLNSVLPIVFRVSITYFN